MAAGDATLKVGATQIIFRESTDYASIATVNKLENAGTPTYVDLDLGDVQAGAIEESKKFDFTANRAPKYSIMASFEFATADASPVSGEEIALYLAPSPIAGDANGNPMSITGAGGTGPTGDGTAAELRLACKPIGVFKVTDDESTVVQIAYCGTFTPPERYGILIVHNDTTSDLHTDAVEMHIVFTPIIPNVESA